jgi:hypothetical protein
MTKIMWWDHKPEDTAVRSAEPVVAHVSKSDGSVLTSPSSFSQFPQQHPACLTTLSDIWVKHTYINYQSIE